ncbi:LIC_12616 family protein [Sporohalobacter salinus]|uniref:phage neck terminator protein n=1 Tax=Sporohalobacter salinus TaxID=1494606 RepID=UPI00195FBD28|nr:hypothetical protein [Sporohalobacter salinus]MBM7623651.1 hypothetical protein [Sporohalobacter salinus]
MIDIVAIEEGLYDAWNNYLADKLGSAPQILLANQDIPEDQLESERVMYNVSTPYETNTQTVESREVVPSTDDNFKNDVIYHYLLAPRITISVNVYSDSQGDARKIALQLREWFEIDKLGNRFFKENHNGVVKQNTLTEVDDRTTMVETSYQKRFSFDCDVELEEEISVREKTIEVIKLDKNDHIETIDV